MFLFNMVVVLGKNIIYVKVKVFNCYMKELIYVIFVKDCFGVYFIEVKVDFILEEVKFGNKFIFYIEIVVEMKGSELEGIEYE